MPKGRGTRRKEEKTWEKEGLTRQRRFLVQSRVLALSSRGERRELSPEIKEITSPAGYLSGRKASLEGREHHLRRGKAGESEQPGGKKGKEKNVRV